MDDTNTVEVAENNIQAADTQTAQIAATGTQTVKDAAIDNFDVIREQVSPFRSFATEKEFDDLCGGIKGNAEKAAEKKLLAQLGLKQGEADKLELFKTAYESNLSNEEKKSIEIDGLMNDKNSLKSQLEENEYMISALSQLSGKTIEDVDKIVKMAKGLKDDNTDINTAITTVISLLGTKEPAQSVPKGTALKQPDNTIKKPPEDIFMAGFNQN